MVHTAPIRPSSGGFASLLAVTFAAVGCDEPEAASRAQPDPPLTPEAGFVELARETYRVGQTELVSSPARLFYDFQPAQEPGPEAPLFVLSGGGPAASVTFLLAYHAPHAIADPSVTTATLARNEWSLTRLGHLFSPDARNAGFSYALLDDPSDPALRDAEFRLDNYNVYRDAADAWQVLLDFLDRHPALSTHPIYFLAESYGAVRVSVMLSFVLHSAEYANEQREFWAPGLFDRLAALHVGGQILLEPWFAGARQAMVAGQLLEQPGSVLEALAAEAGTTYVRCSEQAGDCDPYANARALLDAIGRSPYDVRAGSDWSERHADLVANAATQRDVLAGITGVDRSSLDQILGGDRTRAYRFADVGQGLFLERGDLEQTYGPLQPWDAHFVPQSIEARDVFLSESANAVNANPNQDRWGEVLLDNLRTTPTFMSRADFDFVIFGPALVPVLASYPEVSGASLLNTSSGDRVQVEFTDGTSRIVECPAYASSHSVSRDRPAELFRDIAAFLGQTQP